MKQQFEPTPFWRVICDESSMESIFDVNPYEMNRQLDHMFSNDNIDSSDSDHSNEILGFHTPKRHYSSEDPKEDLKTP